MSEFKAIKEGMSISSVEWILGDGTLTSSSSYDLSDSTLNIKSYEWGDYDTGYISIMFDNGEVYSKTQIGIQY